QELLVERDRRDQQRPLLLGGGTQRDQRLAGGVGEPGGAPVGRQQLVLLGQRRGSLRARVQHRRGGVGQIPEVDEQWPELSQERWQQVERPGGVGCLLSRGHGGGVRGQDPLTDRLPILGQRRQHGVRVLGQLGKLLVLLGQDLQ